MKASYLCVFRFVLSVLISSLSICPFLSAAVRVEVTVTPASVYLRPGSSVTFHATVSGVKGQKVYWSATQGTIASTGVYVAGSSGPAIVTAQSAQSRRTVGTASVNIIAPPTEYSVARTDQNIEQLPSPMPQWGGPVGIGAKWCNPAFANLCTIRATDSLTSTGAANATMQTADSGEIVLWSIDSRHLIVRGTGARKYVVGFDPASETVTRTPISFGYSSVLFSRNDPQTMYALDGTAVRVVRATADWSTIESDTVMFDFAECLPEGFHKTWNGTFGSVLDDNSFRVAFSNTSGQGSGIYMAAYQTEAVGTVPAGCYVLNTATGMVSGPTGEIGLVDDGVKPLEDRFTMHAGGGGQNPRYAMVNYSMRQPDDKTPGCLVGDCQAHNPYVWEIGTTHLRTCPLQCDGHSAKGYKSWATGKKYKLHDYANPQTPLTPMVNLPAGFPDQHGSWINTNEDDSSPAFLVSTDVTPVIPYPTWGYNEVLAIAADGSQKTWRFGQTLNSGRSKYFIVQNAVGVVSQDGRWVAFTSDMCGGVCASPAPLGYETDGKTPRADVFIMEAR